MQDEIVDRRRIDEISQVLVGARKAGRGLPGFPGALPATLTASYAVQLHSAGVWPDEIGGWKVGGVPADYIAEFDETRLTGPIFKRKIVHSRMGDETAMGVLPGFAAVEGEWVFRLGDTPEEDRLYIGIEVASSPLPAINDLGPVAVICDFGNNNGLIVGPEIEDWRNVKPGPLQIETQIDGIVVGQKEVTNFPQDGLAAVAFLRDHAAKYEIALPAGTYCTSGAITGVHEAEAGAKAVCSFGPFGSLGVRFVPARAESV